MRRDEFEEAAATGVKSFITGQVLFLLLVFGLPGLALTIGAARVIVGPFWPLVLVWFVLWLLHRRYTIRPRRRKRQELLRQHHELREEMKNLNGEAYITLLRRDNEVIREIWRLSK